MSGAFIIAITMFLEPDQYKKAAWIIYGGGVFLLALLIYTSRKAWKLLQEEMAQKVGSIFLE